MITQLQPSPNAHSASKMLDPETFAKLSPVHHLIFDFLAEIAPTLVIRLNQTIYSERIPALYRELDLVKLSLQRILGSQRSIPRRKRDALSTCKRLRIDTATLLEIKAMKDLRWIVNGSGYEQLRSPDESGHGKPRLVSLPFPDLDRLSIPWSMVEVFASNIDGHFEFTDSLLEQSSWALSDTTCPKLIHLERPSHDLSSGNFWAYDHVVRYLFERLLRRHPEIRLRVDVRISRYQPGTLYAYIPRFIKTHTQVHFFRPVWEDVSRQEVCPAIAWRIVDHWEQLRRVVDEPAAQYYMEDPEQVRTELARIASEGHEVDDRLLLAENGLLCGRCQLENVGWL